MSKRLFQRRFAQVADVEEDAFLGHRRNRRARESGQSLVRLREKQLVIALAQVGDRGGHGRDPAIEEVAERDVDDPASGQLPERPPGPRPESAPR